MPSVDAELPWLTPEQLEWLEIQDALVEVKDHQQKYDRFMLFQAYPKQLDFFAMGTVKGQRMFNAGNRLGKTEAGAFEMACHLTGDYPSWWEGRRFDHAIDAWAIGLSNLTTRDIVQAKLCGPPLVAGKLGTGMIPKEKIVAVTLSRGITGSYDMVQVRHKSGGISVLTFKSCEAGWEKFQGTAKDFIWQDEEPSDYKIYTECVTRTLDTGGSMIVTYTPLSGVNSELWQAFHDPKDTAKGIVTMSLNEVLSYPNSHLTQKQADEIMASWPAHERLTRASGTPTVGAGAIFTYPKEQISCPPIYEPGGQVSGGWGLDFGGQGGTTLKYAHPFGAVFGVHDRASDVIYIMRAIRLPGGRVLEHAAAMRRVSADAIAFWPHDGHRTTDVTTQKDTRGQYADAGVNMYLTHATFATGGYSTEAGILEMQRRMETGRLKICENLTEWWEEYGSYSRDEKGEIVKVNDDLMSATRILVMMLPRFGRIFSMGDPASRPYNRGQTGRQRVLRAEGADDSYFGFDD